MLNEYKERGKLHCHTEESLRDSAETIENLVKRAKEMGVPALALTNHAIMLDNYEFVKCCESNGIIPMPSFEGYYSDDNDLVKDSHIGLYFTDFEAYRYGGMALTEANRNMHNGKPVLTTKILEKYFGKESPVYGKVIFTSACVKGVFAHFMSANDEINGEIHKLSLTKNELHFNKNEYEKQKQELSEYESKKDLLKNEYSNLKKNATKPTVALKKKVDKYANDINSNEYKKAFQIYTETIENANKAQKSLLEIGTKLEKLELKIKEHKAILKNQEILFTKHEVLTNKINTLANKRLDENKLYELMKEKAYKMIDIFGKDNIYCEIQYHNLEIEKYNYSFVVKLAKELNLKLCCSNDSHFAYPGKDSVKARQMMLSLRFEKYVKESIDQKEYYLKSDAELKEILLKIFDEDIVNKAFDGVDEIVDKCKNFKYVVDKHYPKIKGDAKTKLTKLVYGNIKRLYGNSWDIKKQERLEYELSVIDKLDLNHYFCIVSEFINYAKDLMKTTKSGIGYPIGPGRGSAGGSVVAYLSGITHIDPFKFNLLFERFLNENRITMADIDIDLSEEVRNATILHVKKMYGEDSVCSIMTKDTFASKFAIRSASKFKGLEDYGDSQKYYNIGDELAKRVPSEINMTLEKCKDEFSDITSKLEKEILHLASLIEGRISGYGQHAAAVIISDNDNVSEYIALKWYESTQTFACQCTKETAEEIGLLKMDFLGLKTLDICTKTIRLIKRNYGISINLDDIPYEDDVFANIFAKGDTLAVFQVESKGMRDMLTKLKPSCIEDIIAGIALYRPGPMDFIPQYIEAKHNPKSIKYLCPQLEPILKKTYGCIVYQEQVMEIVRELAGYSMKDADNVRRFMSKKKEKKLAEEREIFINGSIDKNIEGCVNRGISADIANKIFDNMIDFAKYAFNKSHAAAYAVVAYQTAWLKYHYPVEFYTSNMNIVRKEKLPALINEVKQKGIEFIKPDINKSNVEFDAVNGSIIYGFKGINGLANKAEKIINVRNEAPFNSFKDFIVRGHIDKATTINLILAGCFDNFCNNRVALLDAFSSLIGIQKKLNEKYKEKEERENLNDGSDNAKKLLANTYKSIINYNNLLENFVIKENLYEDYTKRLQDEYDVCGIYISGHPVSNYQKPENVCNISDLDVGYKKIYGIISNLNICKSKKTGKELAFFDIEDATGKTSVVCFNGEYSKFYSLIAESNIVCIEGKVEVKINEDEECSSQMIVKKILSCKKIVPKLIIHVPNICYYIENIQPLIEFYREYGDDGLELLIHDRMTGEYREYLYSVSKNITALNDKNISIKQI